MFRLIAFLFMLSVSWLFNADGGEGGGDSRAAGGSEAGGGDGAGDGAGDSGAGEDGGEDSGASGAGEQPVAKHTDADVDKFKGSARTEERTAWLNALGVESREEAQRMIDAQRELDEAAKTETQREKEAREAAENRAKELETTLNQERISFRLEAALRADGVPQERIEDALALAERTPEYKQLTINKDNQVEGLADVVKATLEPRQWLKEEQQQQRRRAVDTSRGGTVSGEEVEPGLGRLRVAYGP